MNRTMRGESVYPRSTPEITVGSTSSAELTEREYDVLRQLALGYRSTLQLVVDVVSKRLILPKF